jgi:hypothetical protein
MSLQKFPDYMYEIVVDSGEVELGTYTIDENGELTNLYVTMMINGVSSIANEAVYMRCIRSSSPGTPIQSSSILVSSFVTGSQSWMGKVRFDFDKQSLKSGDTIQIFLGTTSYTRGATEIGAILNYIGSSGTFEVTDNKAAYLTLFNNR